VEVFDARLGQLFLNHILHGPVTHTLLAEEHSSLTIALQDQWDSAQLLREAELVVLPAGFAMDETGPGAGNAPCETNG
jgi:hypothetical protein